MTTLNTMPSDARIWVYQSNRVLSDAEVKEIENAGKLFISEWVAHEASLKSSFDVLHNLFIVIAVDEKQAMASGCSIDTSIRFFKGLEQKMNLDLFDRMQVAFRKGNEISVCKLSEFEKLASQGLVNEATIVFNNMVTTKAAFDWEWEVPLKNSWQNRVLA
ncbi:MAG: ABC transporter ATPase [Bacteroidetes bacterium]|nr:ABC transporter ATPase [Bacteroidota bacterium]